MALSPNGALAAATDALGRVLLINTRIAAVVRVWKGYRDARCYWVTTLPPTQADSEGDQRSTSSHEQHTQGSSTSSSHGGGAAGGGGGGVHQLCIHARRRGLLEVWNVPLGSRAAAFNVGVGSIVVPTRTPAHQSPSSPLLPAGGAGAAGLNVMVVHTSSRVYVLRLPYSSALSDSASSHLQQRHTLTALTSLVAELDPAQPQLSTSRVDALLSQLTSPAFLRAALDAAFALRAAPTRDTQRQLVDAVFRRCTADPALACRQAPATASSSSSSSSSSSGAGATTAAKALDVDALELHMWFNIRKRQYGAYKVPLHVLLAAFFCARQRRCDR